MTFAEFLKARVTAIVAAGHGNDLARVWPEGVATFKSGLSHTDDELARIEASVQIVERCHRLEFVEGDPRARVTPAPFDPAPVASPAPLIDEGPTVDIEDVDAVRRAYEALADDDRATLDLLTHMAAGCGHRLSLVDHPSLRRWEIARALIVCAPLCMNDISALLDYPPSMGAAVGTLTIARAQRLRDAAEARSANHLRKEAMA